jgi:hypothetical protein
MVCKIASVERTGLHYTPQYVLTRDQVDALGPGAIKISYRAWFSVTRLRVSATLVHVSRSLRDLGLIGRVVAHFIVDGLRESSNSSSSRSVHWSANRNRRAL